MAFGGTPVVLTQGGSDTDSSSYTTASVSPGANRTILLGFVLDRLVAGMSAGSVSGLGLTWTLADIVGGANNEPFIVLWRAQTGPVAPTAGTITVSGLTDGGANTAVGAIWCVVEITNTELAINDGIIQTISGQTANDTLSVTLAAFRDANSGTAAFILSFDNAGGALDITEGSGFTMLASSEASQASNGRTLRIGFEWKTTNDTTVDATTSVANDHLYIIGFELGNLTTSGNRNDPAAFADAGEVIGISDAADPWSVADAGETVVATSTDSESGTFVEDQSTALSESDSASFVDAETPPVATSADSDVVTFVDAGEAVVSTSVDADTGTFTDAGELVSSLSSDADTGLLSDAGETVGVSDGPETFVAADAGEGVLNQLVDADTAALVDAGEDLVVASVDSDTAVLVDAGEVVVSALADPDTATLIDAGEEVVSTVTDGPDTFTFADAGEVVSDTSADSDTGTFVDAGEAINVPITDPDVVTFAESETPPSATLSDVDSGTLTDAESVLNQLVDSDTASVADAETLTPQSSDVGDFADTSGNVNLVNSDAGTFVDAGEFVSESGSSSDSFVLAETETVAKTSKQTIGYEVWIYDAASPTTLLAILHNWTDLEFSVPLSDTGAGRVVLDYYNPIFYSSLASVITSAENIWVIVLDGVPVFAFLPEEQDEVYLEESGSKGYQVAGRGVAMILEWGTILAPWYPGSALSVPVLSTGFGVGPGWPGTPAWFFCRAECAAHVVPGFVVGDMVKLVGINTTPNGVNAQKVEGSCFPVVSMSGSPTNDPYPGTAGVVDLGIYFSSGVSDVHTTVGGSTIAGGTLEKVNGYASISPMQAVATLIAAAQARGACTSVTPTFGTNDSLGNPWSTKFNFEVTTGLNLLSFLSRCADAVGIEWMMQPNLQLIAQPTIGADKSATVRFFVSADQLHRDVKRSRRKINNAVYVEAQSQMTSLSTSPSSISKWGRREVYVSVSTIADGITSSMLSPVILDQNKNEQMSITFKVPSRSGHKEFVDYGVGDTVYLDAEESDQVGPFRVMAISVRVDKDGQVDVELVTNSIIDRKLASITAQLAELTGKDLTKKTL